MTDTIITETDAITMMILLSESMQKRRKTVKEFGVKPENVLVDKSEFGLLNKLYNAYKDSNKGIVLFLKKNKFEPIEM